MDPERTSGQPGAEVLASVVVPSRGGRLRLNTLLDCFEAQDESRFEVIVVIDGDIDDSQGFLAGRPTPLPIQVITFAENRGRSAALNAGIAVARGRVIIRCDDDLEPATDFVRQHLVAHQGSERAVVGLYRNVFPDTPYARVYGRRADAQFRADAYNVPEMSAWRYWAGNVSVTSDVAQQVGPYDEAFRAYGWEDVDWGHRLHLLGVPVVLEPSLETTHRLSAVTAASRVQRAFFSGAARTQFVAKHGLTDFAPRPPDSAWTRLVAVVARGLTQTRAARAGRLADTAARVLPEKAARAVVAVLVEGASRAGYRHGSVKDPSAV